MASCWGSQIQKIQIFNFSMFADMLMTLNMVITKIVMNALEGSFQKYCHDMMITSLANSKLE